MADICPELSLSTPRIPPAERARVPARSPSRRYDLAPRSDQHRLVSNEHAICYRVSIIGIADDC